MADSKKEYSHSGLAEKDLARDPFRQFDRWLQEAEAAREPAPQAMILATASRQGRPSARTMRLRGVDGRGFVFFSSHESRKGRDLEGNPHAALVFNWALLERQVVIEGTVTTLAREECAAFFQSRPRASQLAAWGLSQSAIVPGRNVLETTFKALDSKYAGQAVPVPPHWGGWRLAPETVEFWQGRRNGLHDRLRYRRGPDAWIVERLAP
jgi:pyridoxamine 5'-phosphate oxidase